MAIAWSIIGSRIDLQSSTYGPPPHCLLKGARFILSCQVFNRCKSNPPKQSNKKQAESSDSDGNIPAGEVSPTVEAKSPSNDWYLVVLAIDKIFFIIFFIQVSIANVSFYLKVWK